VDASAGGVDVASGTAGVAGPVVAAVVVAVAVVEDAEFGVGPLTG